ncbi:MAG: peptide chain release factor N(5)-glutamine methyltransferase [Chloroflexota bacterium]|nr:MAG: peptide chain release factor N(5)-glutamine methyltransferase [Chloroflexota bacterium]
MTYGAQLASMRRTLHDAGIEEARLEAELLLAEAVGISRPQLLARLAQPLESTAELTSQHLLSRRAQREPLFYILRRREFYGRELVVGPSVLIPRPETELLVEEAVREVRRLTDRLGRAPVTIDVGTGSGAIAINLAIECPDLTIVATDLSSDALKVARSNAERLGVAQRIAFVHTDLLQGLDRAPDLIVSNPPYIPTGELAELEPEIALFEPRGALDGGPDGLDVIRRLFSRAIDGLHEGGSILLEIGHDQWPTVQSLALSCFPHATVDVLDDLAGWPRVGRIRHYV